MIGGVDWQLIFKSAREGSEPLPSMRRQFRGEADRWNTATVRLPAASVSAPHRS
ncbi:MAG: hypothetical protein ABI579_07900 [Candidatus Sumerlaeota bacterium]